MTDPTFQRIQIPHARHCKKPTPLPRLSWAQTPELWCPGCGRSAATPMPEVFE